MSFVAASANSADAGSVSSTTLAYLAAVTANHTLWTGVRYGGTTDNYSSVSDNVNAGNWTKHDVQNETTGGGCWAYYAQKPQTGAGTPTVTIIFTSAATVRWAIAEDTANLASPVDVSATADQGTSAGTVAGASVATANATDSMIAIFALQNGTGISGDSAGWTNRFAVPSAGAAKLYISTMDVTSTNTYSDTLTATATEAASSIIVALKQPGGAAVLPYPPFQLVVG
jgi:hypothetical protein